MGKASKKVAKKQQQNEMGKQQIKINELKAIISNCRETGKYEEALEAVVALLQLGCRDTDVIFDAAEFYFMAGDYQRATVWINKTLEFLPAHIGARILLTRICMLGDRAQDGLNIMEFVLRTGRQKLTEEQIAQIEEILEYYKYTSDEKELIEGYPNVADFLGLMRSGNEEQSLQEPVEDVFQENTVDALAAESEMKEEPKEPSVTTTINEIMEKSVSLQEKITICNSFAGAYYYDNKLAAAKELLAAALELDAYNNETLRNFAMLSLALNDKNAALQYAAKLGQTDFVLLKLIREHV